MVSRNAPYPLVGSLLLLAGLFTVASSCEEPPPVEEEEEEEEWIPPPDVCNTREEALANPECELTLGKARLELIGLARDQDWFTVRMPGNLTGRSLVHVAAGYSVPNTGVELAVSLLREDGKTSLARGHDAHGQGAPRPLDLVVPFGESNARLLVLASDGSSKGAFDARSPYSVMVEVVEDPDVNEPNDQTPTPIPLSAAGGTLTGTQTGYLATAGDVDLYSLELPAGRKIAYIGIRGPQLNPAPRIRVEYILQDAQGTPVAEGRMANEFLQLDLATARLTNGGSYTLVVRGYRPQGTTEPPPGDLRMQYTVEVRVMDELDSTEPNDSLDTAKVTALSGPGASVTLRSRAERIPDAEWFAFDLPASSAPSVLYYRVRPVSGAGRFPALPGELDRQVRVFTAVTQGATHADRVNACKTNDSVCPKKNAEEFTMGLIDSYCSMTPPRCMRSSREEDVRFGQLGNFEGALPIAPHSSMVRYYLVFEDEMNDFADDGEYELRVEWRADPDEAGRFSGGTEQTVSKPIVYDSGASFPVPPSGPTFELEGRLTYGHGFWRNMSAENGNGVRGPWDYDAITSDQDRYELVFPTGLPDPKDQTWELQWEVDHPSGGGAPYDLILELEFCDGDRSPSGCSVVARTIGYKSGNLGAWHSAGQSGVTFQPVYQRSSDSLRTQVTALPWGCFCFERRFVKGGKFYINVVGVDRVSYADVPYRIRTAITSYPRSYGSGTCPAPVAAADGGYEQGCQFTR